MVEGELKYNHLCKPFIYKQKIIHEWEEADQLKTACTDERKNVNAVEVSLLSQSMKAANRFHPHSKFEKKKWFPDTTLRGGSMKVSNKFLYGVIALQRSNSKCLKWHLSSYLDVQTQKL